MEAKNSIPELSPKIKYFNMCGVDFEIAAISSKCLTLTSLKTGKVVQFNSHGALNVFVEQLRWYMSHKAAMAQQAA